MNNDNQPKLSVVIPVYNEAGGIDRFMNRLESVLSAFPFPWEAIFVDDGSKDATWSKLLHFHQKKSNITIISLSRNFGKDTAIFAGLADARGDATVVIDADLQDPPETIPDMIKQWEEGYEIVFGLRQNRQGEPLLRKLLAALFYRVIQLMSECDLPINTGDFCLLDRRVVEEINTMQERTRYFKGLISWVGFRRATIGYCRKPRETGRSKWSYHRLVLFALDALTSYSRLPLRLGIVMGFGAALLGAIYGLYVIFYTLIIGGDVPGYASLVIIILFLGGVQLFSIGIVSEYIGHLFIETKQRPLFIVREKKQPDHSTGPE